MAPVESGTASGPRRLKGESRKKALKTEAEKAAALITHHRLSGWDLKTLKSLAFQRFLCVPGMAQF